MATVAGVVGLAVHQNTPEARLLAAAGIWAIAGMLVWGALRDERQLGALVRAWPRFVAYRPARYAYETTRLRTPAPYMVMAYATLALAVVAFWTLKSNGKDAVIDVTQVGWGTVWIVVAIAAVLIGIVYLLLRRRSTNLRAVYKTEQNRRRPPEEIRPPAPEPNAAGRGRGA